MDLSEWKNSIPKPLAIIFGILLVGILIYFFVIKSKNLTPPTNNSPPVQSKAPSASIDTNKPKSVPTPSGNSLAFPKSNSIPIQSKAPSESIDTNKQKSVPTPLGNSLDFSNSNSPPDQSKAPSESIDINKLKSTPTPSKSPNANSLDIIFLVILLILLAISIVTNVLFFKWRFRANDKQRSFVPEVLIDSVNSTVNDLAKTFKDMAEQHSANIDQSKRASKNTKTLFDDLMESFTVLQTTLDSRDKEIQRLKKGYDSEIFRKFLGRFFRVDKVLSDEINAAKKENSNNLESLEDIQNILRDAFEECGVLSFSPKLGGDSRKDFGIADNPKTIPPVNQEDDFVIAEVLEEGFKLETPSGPQCIKKAKVIVFKSEQGD